jgi:GxxExxY protein
MDEQSSRELTGKSILNAAFRVHSELGPGLLECVYESALAFELASTGQSVERQKPIPVSFRNVVLSDVGFRADMIVNSLVLVELKSVQQITDLHKRRHGTTCV